MTAQKPNLVGRISGVIFARAKTWFKTFKSLTAKVLFKKKTGLLRYEWLYSDNSDCSKSPLVDITASSQHIRLYLGTSGDQSTRNPLLHLRDLLEKYVDVGRAIKITTKLETGEWPPEKGLDRLGEYLAYIGKEEVDFEHWTELNVSLPTNAPLPFIAHSLHSLPPYALANLKRLTWSAHREQLITSWLPFTPTLLYTLANLVMCCDLSLIDCSYILHYGKQLNELTVRTLRRDISPVLSKKIHASEVTHLISLTLRSDDDLVPLLTQCEFPSLRRIDLDLLYPNTLTFRSFKFWSNLETVNLSGDLTPEDVHWIGSQYSHVHHILKFISGLAIIRCASATRC
ncbi:hypothetical protein C0995_009091 [Termitomyces sp. Mi166|nr:hypothetical protein C0995_009091 [Termitomyces sp. Mi166\